MELSCVKTKAIDSIMAYRGHCYQLFVVIFSTVLLEVFKGNEQIDSNKSPKSLINVHNYIKQLGLSL